jgi:cytochrome c-type biogenesis protein CcmH
MILWVVLALMTAAAVAAVLWPLARATPRQGAAPADAAPPSANELAVYRDQLAEVDRDRAAGRIGEAEAAAARLEVSRRLLAAADKVDAEGAVAPLAARRRAAALASVTLLPIGALGLYLWLGSPDLPGEPVASRQQMPANHQSLANLLTQVEQHVARNPEDGRGWEVLAPVYLRLGRFEEAVRARRNALRLLGATAERESDLGEALTAEANGVVTHDAKATFERALKLDGADVRSRFFLGLAAEQDGRRAEAAKIWRELVSGAPDDASWVDFVKAALARVEGTAPVAAAPTGGSPDAGRPDGAARNPAQAGAGPSREDMAAASELTPEQRSEMIRGMVDRLAERLQRDGSDVEGWLRLVRAYAVLGDRDKARAAATDARRALAPEPDKIRRLDELVKGLGLEG